MKFFLNMLNLQLMLFLLIIVGIVLRKKGIIDDNSKKTISDMLINVICSNNFFSYSVVCYIHK